MEVSTGKLLNIPPLSEISQRTPAVNDFFGYKSIKNAMNSKFSFSIFSLTRKLASILRPRISHRQDILFPCAMVHRHVSTTVSLVSKYPGELERFDSLLPIGERLRDLSISGKRCPPETAVTILAISRSLIQLTSTHLQCRKEGLNFPEIFDPIAELIDDILITSRSDASNVIRLMAMTSPLFDLLDNIARIKTKFETSEILIPKRMVTSQETVSNAPMFGFDNCPGNLSLKIFNVTSRSDEHIRKFVTGNILSGNSCEIGRVALVILKESVSVPVSIENLKAYASEINFRLRKEWTYLQSINSNWFSMLKESGWGLALASSLKKLSLSLSTRGIVPLRNSSYCNSKEISRFKETVLREYFSLEKISSGSSSKFLSKFLSFIISIDSDCTVEFSYGISIVMDLVAWIISQPVCEKTHVDLSDKIKINDLSQMMEIVWQTIAGDKFADVLTNKFGIFSLMQRTWKFLMI